MSGGYAIIMWHTFLKAAGRFGPVWEHLLFRRQFTVKHAAFYDDRRLPAMGETCDNS